MTSVITQAALFFPGFFAILALCACFQRRRARRHGQWRYLTPGPYYWFGMASGVVVTAVATLVVAGERVDRASGLLFTAFFAVLTIVLALHGIIAEVRWNRHVVEQRTLLGKRLRLSWSMLAQAGDDWGGGIWICAFDAPRLRFSPYDNGFEELMSKVQRHLPRGGPPAEPEPVAEADLALAPLRAV